MTSDEEASNQKSGSERKEKRLKKIASPPKSPKSKSKKSQSIIKKLKLKSKSVSERTSPRAVAAEGDLVLQKNLGSSSLLERQTPEGDDNFALTKSASETNLKETWRSAQNLADDSGKEVAESAGTSETDKSEKQKVFPERTKSLENLKDMLTYGELILDKTAETVKQFLNLFSIFITHDYVDEVYLIIFQVKSHKHHRNGFSPR